MKLFEYVPLAIRTEKPLPQLERFVHGCMGLVTEIGEITTEIKRMHIYGKPFDAERKVHILEEVGDVMWYIAILLDECIKPQDMLKGFPDYPVGQGVPHWDSMVLGLGVHCGTICACTQNIIHGDYLPTDALVEMSMAIGVIISRMAVLAVACDSTLGEAMAQNIAKLQVRYPDKYSNEAAEGRADKAGADARVS